MTEGRPTLSTVSVVISANDSLSRRGGLAVYGSLIFFTVLIAVTWSVLGFWLVLPFAGLELAVLGTALFIVRRRADYRELLVISPEAVILERGRHRERETKRWATAWTRFELVAGLGPATASRLLIVSAGKRTEIARMLAEDERCTLHRRLCELVTAAQRGATEQRSVDDGRPTQADTD